jgi:hypothetical protein
MTNELEAKYREVFESYYSHEPMGTSEEIISELQNLAQRLGWWDVCEIIDEGYWGNALDVEELMPQIQR